MKRFLIILGCILYCLFPFDIVPEVIPIIGVLDDLAVIGLTVRQLAQGRRAKPEEVA